MLPGFLFWVKIYDFSTLMMVAFCLWALAAGRMRFYILLFALACINKETIIFLTVFFAVWYFPRLGRDRFTILLTCQIAVFITIQLVIRNVFRDNFIGDSFLQVSQVEAFFAGYGIQTLVNVLFAGLCMTYHWPEKPAFLRIALVVLFPIQFAAYFFFCHLPEYRNLFEVFPVLTLLAADSLVAMTGITRR